MVESLSFWETSAFAEALIQFDSSRNGPICERIVRAVSPHPDPLSRKRWIMPERQALNAACVARQRLECASLLALLLAARSNSRRLGFRSGTKAATSRRSPNAFAPAKPPAA